MLTPIALSDETLSFLMKLVEHLHPADRSAFLRTLAAELRREPGELADGVVHRVARRIFQSGFFKAPKIDNPKPWTPARLARQKAATPILND